MNKTFTSFLLIASLALGGAGLGYGIYTKNHSYSETEYNENYNLGLKDGYNAGCKDNEEFRNQIDAYLLQIRELSAERSALELLKNDYKQKYEAGLITNSEYSARITEYEAQVLRLTTDLESCRELLNDAGVANTYVVMFQVDGVNYDSQVITGNNTQLITPVVPSKDYHRFVGWSKDGGLNIVNDLSSEIITENTTFTAIFEAITFAVKYNTGLETITIMQPAGELQNIPANPTIQDKEFLGWSLDGVNIIDLNNQTITGNIEYTAVYKTLRLIVDNVVINNGCWYTGSSGNKTLSDAYNNGETLATARYAFNFEVLDLTNVKSVYVEFTLTLGGVKNIFTDLFVDGVRTNHCSGSVNYAVNGQTYTSKGSGFNFQYGESQSDGSVVLNGNSDVLAQFYGININPSTGSMLTAEEFYNLHMNAEISLRIIYEYK